MRRMDRARVYPLFVRLEGRDVLVAGAGPVAEKRIVELVGAGARVRVVAPSATDTVAALAASGAIAWDARRFEDADLGAAWLVVSATGDPDAQRRIFAAAERARTFVLAVDDPPNGSAASGSVVRRPPFLIAISSSGEAPALTRLVREVLESALPEDRWVRAARDLRRRWKRDGTPMGARFAELVRELRSLDRDG